MKLGTVVYSSKIYNLDYMTLEEMKILLKKIEEEKKEDFIKAKSIIKNNKEQI